jgi:hypothetical protein
MTTSRATATGPAQMTDDIRGPARPGKRDAGLAAWADRGSAGQMRYPGRRSKGLPDVRPCGSAEAGWQEKIQP